MQIYIFTLLAFSWLTAVSEYMLYKFIVFLSDTLTGDMVVYACREETCSSLPMRQPLELLSHPARKHNTLK